jgi:tRNA G26 N,N-dimethylase Trm1
MVVDSLDAAGLSASGLRSIRYAKEIPDLDFVVANDMLPAGINDFSSAFLLGVHDPSPPQLSNLSNAIYYSTTFHLGRSFPALAM